MHHTHEHSLEALGFGSHWSLVEEPADGPLLGRVMSRQATRFEVATRHGILTAELSGRISWSTSDEADLPVVGDWVLGWWDNPGQTDGLGLILERLPRTGTLSRIAPGGSSRVQMLAANVDLLVVVWPLDRAEETGSTLRAARLAEGGHDTWMRWAMVQRFLSMAAAGGVRPILVLSKADLHPTAVHEDLRAQARERWPDLTVLVVGQPNGAPDGYDAVAAMLGRGSTAVFAGLSGAGKSTLLNALADYELATVKASRDSDHKGRHTTTHRELHALPNGALVVDSPGIRELGLVAGEGGSGPEGFDDIEELAAACRFGDCTHQTEPGCAIRDALDTGTLLPERIELWRKQNAELAWLAQRGIRAAMKSGDKELTGKEIWDAGEDQRKWKQIHKSMRNFSKEHKGSR